MLDVENNEMLCFLPAGGLHFCLDAKTKQKDQGYFWA